MYKISQDLKRKNIPGHVLEHLDYISHFQVKAQVGGFTFLLLDLFILLPLLTPQNNIFLWIIAPLLVFVSVWAIWILIRNVEKTELESILFLGCLGGVGSLSYFLIGLKYSYVLGISSFVYYLFSVLLYLLALFLFVRHYKNKFSTIEKRPKKTTPKWHYTVLSVSVPIGYILGHYLVGASEYLMLSVLTLIFYGFSLTYMFLFIKFLHKFLYIKTNYHFARFSKP
ncbi:hypothetical protein SLL00_05925 [Metabacillus indicus]|uniref:hypothetical protein n=1 Tax=Metabacillus indicus TaxID=246786 RepID=UPI002A033636|nr:hypothetical protein [Metabacillus indicus]MDX8289319.1 hypothetical protein [Metabacillus indicus]